MPKDEVWGQKDGENLRARKTSGAKYNPNQFLHQMRAQLHVTKDMEKQDWFPKDHKGRPIDKSRMTEKECATVVARGGKIVYYRNHWYAKGHEPKGRRGR